LLYFTANALKESELCIGCSSGWKFCVRLIWTLKSKKPKKPIKNLKKPKNLKTFSKKPRFFPALRRTAQTAAFVVNF